MDCPGNSWIWVMVLEKWAAFDAPYQPFWAWIHGWNFLDPGSTFGNWIETLKQQNELIWIEGKIRGYDLEQSELSLVQVHLSHGEGQIDVEELEIALPGSKFKRLNLYRERNINLYGRIQDHQDLGSRWKLELKLGCQSFQQSSE